MDPFLVFVAICCILTPIAIKIIADEEKREAINILGIDTIHIITTADAHSPEAKQKLKDALDIAEQEKECLFLYKIRRILIKLQNSNVFISLPADFQKIVVQSIIDIDVQISKADKDCDPVLIFPMEALKMLSRAESVNTREFTWSMKKAYEEMDRIYKALKKLRREFRIKTSPL